MSWVQHSAPLQPALNGLRLSLVAVWLGTALATVLSWHGAGRELLVQGGVNHPHWQNLLMAGGGVLDAALGLALWWHPSRLTYLCAGVAMLGMTLLATVMLPSLWWHPLGPLLKNLPIAAGLWVLWQSSASTHAPSAPTPP